eukprot:502932-Amphidinium_carterae.1
MIESMRNGLHTNRARDPCLLKSGLQAGGAAYGGALAAWNQAMRYEGKVIYSTCLSALTVPTEADD